MLSVGASVEIQRHKQAKEWGVKDYRKNPKTEATGRRSCEQIGTLVHYWWECKKVQLLWETGQWLCTILNIEQPYDPARLLLGTSLKK